MLHDVLFFLLGLIMVVAGGNYLTDGATVIARKMHVSGLVIGLTVVAFGSSAPDLVVCLMSTVQNHSQLALGDVVGANIFDLLLVVGVVAVIRPVSITSDMQWKGLPMVVLASAALFFCGDDKLFDGSSSDIINRTDGLMFLLFFIIFMVYTFSMSRQGQPSEDDKQPDKSPVSRRQLVVAAVSVVGSLAAFNIFFILGTCAVVRPLDTGSISVFDFSTLVAGALVVWIFGALTGPKVINRREGIILILLYAVYSTKLILDVIHH